MLAFVEPSPNIRPFVLPPLGEQHELVASRLGRIRLQPVFEQRDRRDLLIVPNPSAWERVWIGPIRQTHAQAFDYAPRKLTPTRGQRMRTYCEKLDSWYRLRPQTHAAWEHFERDRSSDFSIMRIDVGMYHAGKSPDELVRTLRPNEFPLDPYTFFIALYMAREARTPTLHADTTQFVLCAGAQYDPEGKERWADTVCWISCLNQDTAEWNWSERARDLHLHATGFVEPSLIGKK